MYDSRPDTYKHIGRVRELLGDVITDLIYRGDRHDESKLVSPEVEAFDALGPPGAVKYDSPEYKANLDALEGALDHHYRNNRHHPNHWPNGIHDMSMIDMLEMLCDWKASCERYGNDFAETLPINTKRFGYGEELETLFRRTAEELGWL